MTTYRYLATSELPSIPLRWTNNDGTAIDLSSVTWSLKLVNASGTTVLTKSTNITGYASFQGTTPNDYNVLIAWASGDLATSGVAGGTFKARNGTFVLQYTSGSNQSEPFDGDLTIKVEAAPS
jgi:hypothetical protein